MTQPLLSIITVTKNCAGTLSRTLDSVQAVKCPEFEYVVIDGVSTDGTLEMLRERGSLIDQLVCATDTGIYNAMNKAIAMARGKWALFINGDDELLPDGFMQVAAALRAQQGDGIVCGTTLVGSAQSPSEVLVAQPWRLPFFNTIPHPSTFVSTSLLRQYGFREDLRIAADYDLFLRLFLGRHRFVRLDLPLALHQRGGASGNTLRSQEEIDQVRRERLGWILPLTDLVQQVHGWQKRIRGSRTK